jgi:hypothetical protein
VEGFDRSVIKSQTGHKTDSMFFLYDKVAEEIINMSGNTCNNFDAILEHVAASVAKATENGSSCGTIENLIGRRWRGKAA